MMLGIGQLGDTTTTGTTPSAFTSFTTGLQQWTSPSAALSTTTTLLSNPSTAFSSTALPFTLGVLAVPLGVLLLVMNMGGRK